MIMVYTPRDVVGAAALALMVLCGLFWLLWQLIRFVWKHVIKPLFSLLYTLAVIVLFASGCAGASGPTPHVGLRNFEHRDHCELRDTYIWVSLNWDL